MEAMNESIFEPQWNVPLEPYSVLVFTVGPEGIPKSKIAEFSNDLNALGRKYQSQVFYAPAGWSAEKAIMKG